MKHYYFLMVAALLLMNITFTYFSGKYSGQITKENDSLRRDNFVLHTEIMRRDSIIRAGYNSVSRLQYIMGVDTIDGIITYEEKMLLSERQINKLNKADLSNVK